MAHKGDAPTGTIGTTFRSILGNGWRKAPPARHNPRHIVLPQTPIISPPIAVFDGIYILLHLPKIYTVYVAFEAPRWVPLFLSFFSFVDDAPFPSPSDRFPQVILHAVLTKLHSTYGTCLFGTPF